MLHRFLERSAVEYFGEKVNLPGMGRKREARPEPEMEEWERKRAEMLERSHHSYYSAGAITEAEAADGQTKELSNFGQFQAFIETKPMLLTSLKGKAKIVGGAAGYYFTFILSGT